MPICTAVRRPRRRITPGLASVAATEGASRCLYPVNRSTWPAGKPWEAARETPGTGTGRAVASPGFPLRRITPGLASVLATQGAGRCLYPVNAPRGRRAGLGKRAGKLRLQAPAEPLPVPVFPGTRITAGLASVLATQGARRCLYPVNPSGHAGKVTGGAGRHGGVPARPAHYGCRPHIPSTLRRHNIPRHRLWETASPRAWLYYFATHHSLF